MSDRHLLKEDESSSISGSHLKVTYVEASDSYRIDVLSQNGARELDRNYKPQRFLERGDALLISQPHGVKRLLLGEKICVEFERGGTRKVPLPPSLSPDGSQTLPVDTGGTPTTNDR